MERFRDPVLLETGRCCCAGLLAAFFLLFAGRVPILVEESGQEGRQSRVLPSLLIRTGFECFRRLLLCCCWTLAIPAPDMSCAVGRFLLRQLGPLSVAVVDGRAPWR